MGGPRLKKVCPACGQTSISNLRSRKYKCYICKKTFEVPRLRLVSQSGNCVNFRVKVEPEPDAI